MNRPRDIMPRNNNNEPHGYWERHKINIYTGNITWFTGHFINGIATGLWKEYDYKGVLNIKEYYIL